jgi:hypothetical protein
MVLANTLAYNNMATIAAVNFIVQAPSGLMYAGKARSLPFEQSHLGGSTQVGFCFRLRWK